MCGEVNIYYVEKGLFVFFLRLGRFVESLDDTLHILTCDGGLVGCGVNFLFQQVGQGFKTGPLFPVPVRAPRPESAEY